MKQSQALDVMKLGHNVFLTGEPGAGKTHVINEFIAHCREHDINIGVTASTGIAATHIGGMTIHSWSGIGLNDSLNEAQIKNLSGKSTLQTRFRKTRVLIIDEISMLDKARLELINQICKALKKNDKPFGGLQVILCGDLFQLPPVSRDNKPPAFAHSSTAWEELNLKVCYLTEQHRQVDDTAMLHLLREIRARSLSDESLQLLNERLEEKALDDDMTRLYSHNFNVDVVNSRRLQQLEGDTEIFTMLSDGREALVEQLKKSCLAPERLELKVGAQVLCVANNPAAGYVNGTRAEVIDFENRKPVVRLSNGRELTLERHKWKIEDGDKALAEVSQYPLRLAWAITVHKSQGMSLDAAEVDLSRAFTPGMGYVALSRLSRIDGLYLCGINQMALEVSAEISELDDRLQRQSRQVLESLETIKPSKLSELHQHIRANLASSYATYDKELLEQLRNWRGLMAKKQKVPNYIVFNDKTLIALAAEQPITKETLLEVPGVGPKKVQLYGDDILKLINNHLGRLAL